MNNTRERKLVLVFGGLLILLVAAASLLKQPNDDTDRSPTTYNNGSAGTRAAFLLLGDLGFSTRRFEQSTAALASVDAAHTTLILAAPTVPSEDLDTIRVNIASFLKRGGRVLATDLSGAQLLPISSTAQGRQPLGKSCLTNPEGSGALAQAGELYTRDLIRWTDLSPDVHVEQRCGADAVVVSYKFGAGTAIWWSSSLPLSNTGLKDNGSLKLLLASVTGPEEPQREILFDEFLHGIDTSIWDSARGLPLTQLAWQAAAVGLLLILSYSRRNGPIRAPARLPRTSPIEFAQSMGALYRKAGATQAATEAARRRLLRFLVERCGLPRTIFKATPETIVEALQIHLPGDYSILTQHLTQAAEAEYKSLSPGSSLALVKALDHDLKALNERLQQPKDAL